jgi:hypothetical protein
MTGRWDTDWLGRGEKHAMCEFNTGSGRSTYDAVRKALPGQDTGRHRLLWCDELQWFAEAVP